MNTKFKILIGIITFLISLLAAILILPFFIDLNRFKPQIQESVSKNINAKVDFSNIELTILSGVGFALKDVSLVNTDPFFLNKKIFEVKKVNFKIEFIPLLSGKIVGKIEIDSPYINVIKDNDINNITTLIKHENEEVQKQKQNDQISKVEPVPRKSDDSLVYKEDDKKNNNILKNILIESFLIKNADITYTDLQMKNDPVLFENLNLKISNIGVDKDIQIIFSTTVNIKNTEYTLNGPISLKLDTKIAMETSHWKNSVFNGELNLNKLNIKFKDTFIKKEQIPFNVNFSGEVTPFSLTLNSLMLKLESIESRGKVRIEDFKKLNSEIMFELYSKDISSLGEILPQHKSLLSSGSFNLTSHIKGSLTEINSIISKTQLIAHLYKSDIQLAFDEHSIMPLKGQLHVMSDTFKMDEILKPFMNASFKKNEIVQKSPLSEKYIENENNNNQDIVSAVKSKDDKQKLRNDRYYSPPAAEFYLTEKQKQMLFGANFNIDVNIKHFIYDNINLNDLVSNSSINNTIVNMKKLSFKTFNGNLLSEFQVDLAKSPIKYSGSVDFQHIQIQDLIKLIQMKDKSPIEGDVDLNLHFNGFGSTRELIYKTLNSKGFFKFYSGKLNIKNLMGIISEQLQKYASSINIPGLSDSAKKISSVDLGQNNQKDLNGLKGDFEIRNGKVIIKNNITSAQGDIKLDAAIGLDESMGGTALYSASKSVKDLLIKQEKNISYLLDSKGNLQLNLILGGSLSNPSVIVDPKNLKDNILHNTTSAIRDKIKEQIKNNPEVQKVEDAAKKLLKERGLDLGKFGF